MCHPARDAQRYAIRKEIVTARPNKGPAGNWLDWAQLLHRVYLVDVLACPCGRRRPIVGFLISEVVAAILANLGLPTEALPVARAHRPAFDFAYAHAMPGNGRTRKIVAKAEVCHEEDAREAQASSSVILPSAVRARKGGWKVVLSGSA